jgi:mitochondrial fission protein ELM1
MSSQETISVLALLNERKSNNTQILSIANEIAKKGATLHKRYIIFNSLINIPFIWKFIPIWLAIGRNDGFNDIKKCDIILTCGAKSVLYAIYLKKKIFHNAKIVQILKPEFAYKEIDLILLPQHDKKMVYGNKKVIRYIGSLTLQNKEDLISISNQENDDHCIIEGQSQFQKIINSMKKPIIAVYIGGNSKHCFFSDDAISYLAKKVSEIASNMDASLLIITSPRTNQKQIKVFKENLSHANCYISEYKKYCYNPYEICLAQADYHIVTGDSISMISDTLATGKSVYVYADAAKSSKYMNFHNEIFTIGAAKPITLDTQTLENFNPKPLNDIEELSDKILSFIGLQ